VARAATADQQFVTLAAQTDMTEAHLGQLAVEHASSQTVKDYAQMLMTDHTSDYDKISALARKSGLMVPTGLDSDHNKKIAPFEKLKGVAFDKRFAHDMFSGHEAATAAYDKESREGQNADLKKYAKDTLPTLEKHKDGAKQLIK
jgi:putative membrane protein